MKLKKLLAILLTMSILLCTGTVYVANAATSTSTYTVKVSGTAYYDRGQEMLSMINELRTDQGLSKLTIDSTLSKAAMLRALESSVDFSHTRPNGSNCLTVCSKAEGENLASGNSTAAKTFTQWKNSSAHLKNMLFKDYKSIGIACFKVNGQYYWVQMFSTQKGDGVSTTTSAAYSNSVTIKPKDGDKVGINLSESQVTHDINTTLKVRVYRRNPSATSVNCVFTAGSFTWKSSNTKVATVDQAGNVTFVSPGKATITATAKTGTLTVSKLYTVVDKSTLPTVLTESVVRVYGTTRYGTSLNIAEQLKDVWNVSKFSSIVLVYSKNFPDALSGSYLAIKKKAPILVVDSITGGDSSESTIKSYIKSNLKAGGTLYVVGGNSAVKQTYANTVAKAASANVVFLAGSTRYDTNLKTLKKAGVTNQTEILISDASGSTAYIEALSGATTGKPMLLVNRGSKNSDGVYTGTLTDAQLTWLKSTGITKVTLLGSKAHVPATIESQLKKAGFTVSRVSGSTSYESSAKIASKYFSKTNTVTLAWGGNFPDALCGGPLANALGAPLILTKESDKYAKSFASSHTIYNVVAFGGAGSNNDQLTNAAIRAVKNDAIVTLKVDK